MSARGVGSACFVAGLAALFFSAPRPAVAQAPAGGTAELQLVDGDRVVLLGSTLIEREQSHGYVEAALVSRFPGAHVQIRNLGWTGDTVFGEARAGLGKPEDGFAELKKHVLAISPTVILVAYGANESFAGPGGLERFLKGLDTLLAALDETGARIVLIAPPAHEDLGRPLPDPAEHYRNLKLYGAAIAKVAAARGAPFVDLFDLLSKMKPASSPLTGNGIHLTAYGYWRLAPVVEESLGLPARVWQVELDAARGNIAARGTLVRNAKFSADAIRFTAHDRLLPLVPPPDDAPPECRNVAPRILRAFDLPRGTYALKIDGRQVAAGTQREWADGINLAEGPEFEQAERLRQLVVEKNKQFFERWRPPKVIDLFGLRKQVPGRAVEIQPADPLVVAREAAIHGLSKPVEHEYELVPVAHKP